MADVKTDVVYKPGAPGDGGVVINSLNGSNNCVFLENGKCKLDQDGEDRHYHRYWEYVRTDLATKPAADPSAEVVPVATVVKKAMELAREHDWCEAVEQGLREIGIDPSKYIEVKDVNLHLRIPADVTKRRLGRHTDWRNPLIITGTDDGEDELLISNFKTLIANAMTHEILSWVEDIEEVD